MKEGGKVKKRTKMTLTAVVIMELIALLLAAAYAWIESVNKPEIRGQNLSISASSGLMIRMDGSTNSEAVNLNQYLDDGRGSSFMLKECSSPDGKQMFVRDGPLEIQYSTSDEDVRMREANVTDANVRYLSQDFELIAEGNARDVWLDAEKCSLEINSDDPSVGAKPLRLSLEFQPDGEEHVTFVFSTIPGSSMKAQIGPVSQVDANNGQILAHASYYSADNTAGLLLRSFSSINESNPMIHLEQNQSCKVTLRVWLEGTDPDCVDAVAGNTFNLNLRFDSTQDQTGA